MKSFSARFSLAQSLVALVVSFTLVLSAPIIAFASPAESGSSGRSNPATSQTEAPERELQVTSATATASAGGVLLHWTTNSTADNVGFNIYRIKDGQRTRANRQIIPGAIFGPGIPSLMRAGYSYSWFDRDGTAGSVYFIESVSVDGSAKTHQPISAVAGATPGSQQMPEGLSGTSATEGADTFEKSFPAAENQLNSPQGTIQGQWVIAAQTGLKIGIKKDGWYRVTQQQMVAAGFNPTVDIRNLQLFVDANEVAILTNQLAGPFGSGDYIEFYGQGLDTLSTDTRVYYLIAGAAPGKRVTGDIQLDSPPDDPPATPLPTATPLPAATPLLPVTPPATSTPIAPVLRDPIFQTRWVSLDPSWLGSLRLDSATVRRDNESSSAGNSAADNSSAGRAMSDYAPPDNTPAVASYSRKQKTSEETVAGDSATRQNAIPFAPVAAIGNAPKVETSSPQPVVKAGRRSRKSTRKKTRRKLRRQHRQERSHAFAGNGLVATNFDSTIQLTERFNYLSTLLNGDEGNFFGTVISSSPVTVTLTPPNPDLTAVAPATLEFALQGVLNTLTGAPHQVSVQFNGANLGVLDFGALDHPVRSFSIPAAQLLNGANTLKFTKTSTGEICLFDYARLTYPHVFKADSGSLKFSLRGSQSRTVDGFSTPLVRLIDYTDPLSVKIAKPSAEPTAAGYAITVPLSEPFSKDQRLLLAIPSGQFDAPVSLALNQSSTLNLNSNAADFVVVAYKDLIPSLTSLVAQRQSQGHSVLVVDIADVYDEFSFGVHGPQAVRDFLKHAATHWATPPHYVIFAGDASFDPRNYTGAGNRDLVPTKLVDATYDETSSDDWLTDFDNDGIGDIPVGRLPVETLADANLIVSKIVNFVPANVPQNALLVADQDDQFHSFQFVEANDAIQTQLPAAMPVQRINRGIGTTDAQARIDIIAGLNAGKAVVNYSGHGSVDVWTGVSIFAAADARALTNRNKLSFIVVMDCLNGYFQAPTLESMAEAFLRAPSGGAVAAFASSGRTIAQGQHIMSEELYRQLYGSAQSPPLGDAIKIAKAATFDIDVKRTWIFFGDPSMKIR